MHLSMAVYKQCPLNVRCGSTLQFANTVGKMADGFYQVDPSPLQVHPAITSPGNFEPVPQHKAHSTEHRSQLTINETIGEKDHCAALT